MGLTVYAENMGWFHKGSNGLGTAPGDVCLSPPPPPAGPVPVPYVNVCKAGDLIKGSKSVKADGGNPTALENVSECSMSTGNEPATPGLGAGVVTHKIKGKASFTLWSFTVKVEGKGVCRHGDPLLQNTMCTPPNIVAPGATVRLKKALGDSYGTKCAVEYDSAIHRPGITQPQEDAVYGKRCWQCAQQIKKKKRALTPGGRWRREKDYFAVNSKGEMPFAERDRKRMTPDHQPPLNIAWAKGGCNLPEPPPADPSGFKKLMQKPEMVKPHCNAHSNSQGTKVAQAGAAIQNA